MATNFQFELLTCNNALVLTEVYDKKKQIKLLTLASLFTYELFVPERKPANIPSKQRMNWHVIIKYNNKDPAVKQTPLKVRLKSNVT